MSSHANWPMEEVWVSLIREFFRKVSDGVITKSSLQDFLVKKKLFSPSSVVEIPSTSQIVELCNQIWFGVVSEARFKAFLRESLEVSNISYDKAKDLLGRDCFIDPELAVDAIIRATYDLEEGNPERMEMQKAIELLHGPLPFSEELISKCVEENKKEINWILVPVVTRMSIFDLIKYGCSAYFFEPHISSSMSQTYPPCWPRDTKEQRIEIFCQSFGCSICANLSLGWRLVGLNPRVKDSYGTLISNWYKRDKLSIPVGEKPIDAMFGIYFSILNNSIHFSFKCYDPIMTRMSGSPLNHMRIVSGLEIKMLEVPKAVPQPEYSFREISSVITEKISDV